MKRGRKKLNLTDEEIKERNKIKQKEAYGRSKMFLNNDKIKNWNETARESNSHLKESIPFDKCRAYDLKTFRGNTIAIPAQPTIWWKKRHGYID